MSSGSPRQVQLSKLLDLAVSNNPVLKFHLGSERQTGEVTEARRTSCKTCFAELSQVGRIRVVKRNGRKRFGKKAKHLMGFCGQCSSVFRDETLPKRRIQKQLAVPEYNSLLPATRQADKLCATALVSGSAPSKKKKKKRKKDKNAGLTLPPEILARRVDKSDMKKMRGSQKLLGLLNEKSPDTGSRLEKFLTLE